MTKIASNLLELLVIVTAAVLICWGALLKRGVEQGLQERKRMSMISFMLLVSWILLAGIPNFIKGIRENNELARFKRDGSPKGEDKQVVNNHSFKSGKKQKKYHRRPIFKR